MNNICKNCDLGLKREDCSDYEYKECLNGGRKITEWDKFNESKELCKKLGCKQWSIDNCYHELINRGGIKMDLNKMFKLTEQQKILNEINKQSAYQKDMQLYCELGFAQGIVETLKIIKKGRDLKSETMYELIISNFGDDEIGKMVKRLLKEE